MSRLTSIHEGSDRRPCLPDWAFELGRHRVHISMHELKGGIRSTQWGMTVCGPGSARVPRALLGVSPSRLPGETPGTACGTQALPGPRSLKMNHDPNDKATCA
jgi:hypothetical protein